MPPTLQSSAAPRFTGAFLHKVEGKNRITIPAGWRFEEETTLFMIPRTSKRSILVMTQVEYERLVAKAEDLLPGDRSEALEVLGSVQEASLDKGGRISIPDAFFGKLRLPQNKSVWLTGAVWNFNIWSVEDFEEDKAENRVRREEVKSKLGL